MVHRITSDDFWPLKALGDIALSPDGRRVAFVTQSSDREKDRSRSAISLLHLDVHGHAAGAPRQLTSGIKNDSSPVWAPDSRHLLFLSNREGDDSQLWLIDTDGGEARCLTHLLHGVPGRLMEDGSPLPLLPPQPTKMMCCWDANSLTMRQKRS
jgi:dipeptidyl aminopeptidase/acylaminoacyl peptidase